MLAPIHLFIGGDSIAVYSFRTKTGNTNLQGTCNFSRIDNAQLTGQDLQVFTKHTAGETVSLKDYQMQMQRIQKSQFLLSITMFSVLCPVWVV